MADETEESILHMVNADPNRTPTFTLFGNADFYFQSECTYLGADQGRTPAPVTDEGPGCPARTAGTRGTTATYSRRSRTPGRAGSGPGSRTSAELAIWTDHTDVRPTLMTLLGLHDDYTWDGRAIEQI